MNQKLLTNESTCATINQSQIDGESAMVQKNQLSRVRIEGFRSIKKCDIKLESINILIGSNGAGKSNFISALSLLQEVLNKSLKVYTAVKGLPSMFYKGLKNTERISIETFFGENSYGFDLIPTESDSVVFDDEYFGYYGTFDNHSTIERGHSESVWDKGVNNNINNYVQPILAQQNWRVYHFHDTTSSAKVKREHNISNNLNLNYDAGNLAAFLYRLKRFFNRNYVDIVETVRLVAPYFDDFILAPQEGNKELIVLKWKQKDCDDVFNASQLSDGTLRFVCLATLLLQPTELQPATIIIDEPELGLHPSAIVMLAAIIKRIAKNKQIIMSTQSVDLLDEFNTEDVIVVENSENGSLFSRLNSEQLKIWLDEYSLGELWLKNVLNVSK